MPEIKNVSKLLFMISPCYNFCSAKTQQILKNEWIQCSFTIKEGPIIVWIWLQLELQISFEKEMTASACFKETQYTISLKVAS